jgi:hypothetical protein
MAGYIGTKASVVSSGAERKKVFDITTTTTSLTGCSYTPNQVHVFHNGVRLVDGTDYTATDGSTVTLTTAAQNGDEVVVISYATFQTSDTVSASAGGTFSNAVTVNGNLTVDTNTLFVDAANNRVGIGTSSPDAPLSFAGATGQKVQFYDGTQGYGIGVEASEFRFVTDAAGVFTFKNGATYSTATEYMRIDASGNVGIGTSAIGARITLGDASSTDSTNMIRSYRGAGTATYAEFGEGSGGAKLEHVGGGPVYFKTANTERARIDASGNLLVGKTAAIAGTGVLQIFAPSAQSYTSLVCEGSTTSGIRQIRFYNPNGEIGFISTSGTTTTYSTSSDYRLKENVVPLAGAADRLMQIPVCRFNFIADPDTTVDGFLAHEVQAFVPECVTGEKDQVETVEVTDEDGNVTTETRPVYQGIDQSKLVPLLTAALQEALTEIQDLKARVATLEGGAA